ncbi:MAG: CSLREA domain-containing protein [Pyrinomonadaceae bacterium]|nr:CSLREA domain-containing protein [Pyrinomonadaceae bacterium]
MNTLDDHNDGVAGQVDCTLREALAATKGAAPLSSYRATLGQAEPCKHRKFYQGHNI